METSLGNDVGTLPLDPTRFEQVVRNLLSNAIEASPIDEKIRIQTGVSIPGQKALGLGALESENYFEMKMSNRGPGISPEDLQKIFSPFHTTKDYGYGMGLTVCKKVVEDHKGSISVKSDATETVFTVWFPMKQQEPSTRHLISEAQT